MTLKYKWEKMKVNVPNDSGDIPHTHVVIRDIEWYYDVNVKPNDVCDYLFPTHIRKSYKPHEINDIGFFMRKVANFLQESANCDLEELEKDQYFVEFMQDRYEQEALEDWEESNEAY